jgi:hypothetical protein
MLKLDIAHVDAVLNKNRFEYITPEFILRFRPVTLKILIVVDGSINFSTTGFGLGLLIDTLRDPVYNYVRFDVTLADREGIASEDIDADIYQPRYRGFRFDRTESDGSPTLDKYQQVWCFGFNPGNTGFTSDESIENPVYAPLSNGELAVLTRWMNEKQGGVLAMGDHHFLGASMCYRIPRVGTMRRWTNAQGVPPINGANRYDTNRPSTPAQANIAGGNPAQIPFANQGDTVPQPIEVKRYRLRSLSALQRKYRPHPIFCDPQRGVINILPDHPHEGRLYEDDEVEIDGSYNFNDYAGLEYPEAAGIRPQPEVIAWANTLSDPPYNFAKGPTPARRFGLVSIYDGHQANVGRVVVDTTWHHWFSENLVGMKNDTTTNYYERIQTYFRNVGIWLATPSQRSRMLSVANWYSLFTVQGVQEFTRIDPIWLIGSTAKDILGRNVSPCVISEWLIDFIRPEVLQRLDQIFIDDPICLTCPPFELLENYVLGGIIQEMLPLKESLTLELKFGREPVLEPDEEKLAILVEQGIKEGFAVFAKDYTETIQRGTAATDLIQDLMRSECKSAKFLPQDS